MTSNKEDLVDEMRCYSKIIDCYFKSKNDHRKHEMCKNKSLIKLMRLMKTIENKNLIMNAILLLLGLFDDKEEGVADFFNNLGLDLKDLANPNEKSIALSLLKDTIYGN